MTVKNIWTRKMMKMDRKQVAPAFASFIAKAGNMLFLVYIVSGGMFFDSTAMAAGVLPGKGEPAGNIAFAEPVFGKDAGEAYRPGSAVFGKDAVFSGKGAQREVFGKNSSGSAYADRQQFVGKADRCRDAERTGSEDVVKTLSGIVRQGQVRSAEHCSLQVKPGTAPVRIADAGKADAGTAESGVPSVVSQAGKAGENDAGDISGDAAAGKAGASGEETPGQSGNASAGVKVSLKGFDAELMKEIARLREERSRLQEEVRELELARRSLSAESEGLRRELIEALQIIAGQNEKLLRLRSGIAGMYDAEGIAASGSEDVRVREVLKKVSSSGGGLAVAVAEFCREIDSSLKDWQLDEAAEAKVRMQINHIRALAGEFSALNDWEKGSRDMENVRILAVDQNLGAVILPAGTASGLFNGLVCSVPAVPGVKLKIVAVRRFVSAAVVTAGDPASVAVGMKVVAKANAKTEEN